MYRKKAKERPKGKQNAVLIAVRADESDDQATRIKYDYEDLIRTCPHNKIDDDKCMEMFLVEGNSKKPNLHQGFFD